MCQWSGYLHIWNLSTSHNDVSAKNIRFNFWDLPIIPSWPICRNSACSTRKVEKSFLYKWQIIEDQEPVYSRTLQWCGLQRCRRWPPHTGLEDSTRTPSRRGWQHSSKAIQLLPSSLLRCLPPQSGQIWKSESTIISLKSTWYNLPEPATNITAGDVTSLHKDFFGIVDPVRGSDHQFVSSSPAWNITQHLEE